MTDDEISAYAASGEPLDKAGAYGIQGLGGQFIREISGDYYATVGLSPLRLRKILKQADSRIEREEFYFIVEGNSTWL